MPCVGRINSKKACSNERLDGVEQNACIVGHQVIIFVTNGFALRLCFKTAAAAAGGGDKNTAVKATNVASSRRLSTISELCTRCHIMQRGWFRWVRCFVLISVTATLFQGRAAEARNQLRLQAQGQQSEATLNHVASSAGSGSKVGAWHYSVVDWEHILDGHMARGQHGSAGPQPNKSYFFSIKLAAAAIDKIFKACTQYLAGQPAGAHVELRGDAGGIVGVRSDHLTPQKYVKVTVRIVDVAKQETEVTNAFPVG